MYIHTKIFPGCKKEEITKLSDDHFEMRIKEKAENNMANKRVFEIIRILFPGAGHIKIVNGHHSPSKLLSVTMKEDV